MLLGMNKPALRRIGTTRGNCVGRLIPRQATIDILMSLVLEMALQPMLFRDICAASPVWGHPFDEIQDFVSSQSGDMVRIPTSHFSVFSCLQYRIAMIADDVSDR